MTENDAPVLAVDPGRDKCGLAVVGPTGVIHHRAVIPAEELGRRARALLDRYHPRAIVLGDSTTASSCRAALARTCPEMNLVLINERLSSQAARRRYLEAHPPRGWARLLPRGLLTPGEPYDDYAAIILAERYFGSME